MASQWTRCPECGALTRYHQADPLYATWCPPCIDIDLDNAQEREGY